MADLRNASALIGDDSLLSQFLDGYESRPAQLKVAKGMQRAIADQKVAIVEAGTGTGKSAAYLYPAIEAVLDPESWPSVVIVSTADKNLQSQLINKDIPLLQAAYASEGKAVRATLLKGRGNFVCRYRVSEHGDLEQMTLGLDLGEMGENLFRTPEANRDWPSFMQWMASTESGDLDEIPFDMNWELRSEVTIDPDSCTGQSCPEYKSCFAEKRRDIAREAHIIVVNHSLLMLALDIFYRTRGKAQIVPMPTDHETFAATGKVKALVIIDEAHHLEDIATDAFSTEVGIGKFRWLRSRIERFTTKHKGAKGADAFADALEILARYDVLLDEAQTYFNIWIKRFEQAKKPNTTSLTIGNKIDEARGLLDALSDVEKVFDEVAPSWLSDREVPAWDRLGDLTTSLAVAIETCLAPRATETATGKKVEDNYVRFAELNGKNIRLNAKPVDVSLMLRNRLWNIFPSVIATSATLATDARGFTAWKERVGAPSDSLDGIVGSPFDYANMARCYIPENGKLFDPGAGYNDKNYATAMLKRFCGESLRIIKLMDGGTFVLFTSKAQMQKAYNEMYPELVASGYVVLLQTDGINRQRLVDDFKRVGNAVLFAVASFWEGVDIQGHALRCVIIDKLPFPSPDDPIFKARKDALTRKTGNEWAFMDKLMVPQAIIKLKQGFGRLIRKGGDDGDWGVVAIFDGRLRFKPYAGQILASLPRAPRVSSIDDLEPFVKAHRERMGVA